MKKSTSIKKTVLPSSLQGWKFHKTCLVKDFGGKPSKKLLSFDFDDTLICSADPKQKFSSLRNYKPLYKLDLMREKIEKHVSEGFRIVVFSNQSGISRGTSDKEDLLKKFEEFQAKLAIPMTIFIASDKDYYRKPSTGMFDLLEEEFNGGIKIDRSSAIFVGDAAGRPKTKLKKKDFADTDLKFALNANIQFKTPESYFEGLSMSDVPKPKKDLPEPSDKFFSNAENSELTSKETEMIIFVGPPAAGKSSFYHRNLKEKDYVWVNQDTLKTKEKCLKVAAESLKQGKSVCIDATFPEAPKRKEFISLAESLKIPVRCFLFYFEKPLIFHNNTIRSRNIHREIHSSRVMDVQIHTWFKRFVKPSVSEGFSKILEVNFTGQFDNEEDKNTFYSYT